ncbi:MAG: hypothetical protein AABW65_01375 [Nanoarchaeota archaeon]
MEYKKRELDEEKTKQMLLQKSEISLLLDTYDDIFSDFDPRPYTQRALSDDFLLEAKRATRDKEGIFQLRFLIPANQRKVEHEILIKKRLREHFRKHVLMLEEDLHNTKKKGIRMCITGAVMLLLATFILHFLKDNFFLTLLVVLLEPAGWFTAWTGLDQLFYPAKENKPDLNFYRKMVNVEIFFIPY